MAVTRSSATASGTTLASRLTSVGSSPWIRSEKATINQLIEQDLEDFGFSIRHDLDWLNEHMAELFNGGSTGDGFDLVDLMKTPGRLRGLGKTPRTVNKPLVQSSPAKEKLFDIREKNNQPHSDVFTPSNRIFAVTAPSTETQFLKSVEKTSRAVQKSLSPDKHNRIDVEQQQDEEDVDRHDTELPGAPTFEESAQELQRYPSQGQQQEFECENEELEATQRDEDAFISDPTTLKRRSSNKRTSKPDCQTTSRDSGNWSQSAGNSSVFTQQALGKVSNLSPKIHGEVLQEQRQLEKQDDMAVESYMVQKLPLRDGLRSSGLDRSFNSFHTAAESERPSSPFEEDVRMENALQKDKEEPPSIADNFAPSERMPPELRRSSRLSQRASDTITKDKVKLPSPIPRESPYLNCDIPPQSSPPAPYNQSAAEIVSQSPIDLSLEPPVTLTPPKHGEDCVASDSSSESADGSDLGSPLPNLGLIRKSSLSFASLPAREPLSKKSIGSTGGMTSTTEQVKLNGIGRSSWMGRRTAGKSLGPAAAAPQLTEQPSIVTEDHGEPCSRRKRSSTKMLDTNNEIQNLRERKRSRGYSAKETEESSITLVNTHELDEETRQHSKRSTQSLHEKIAQLGKSQKTSIRDTQVGEDTTTAKDITTIDPEYPDLSPLPIPGAKKFPVPATGYREPSPEDWIPSRSASTRPAVVPQPLSNKPELARSKTAPVARSTVREMQQKMEREASINDDQARSSVRRQESPKKALIPLLPPVSIAGTPNPRVATLTAQVNNTSPSPASPIKQHLANMGVNSPLRRPFSFDENQVPPPLRSPSKLNQEDRINGIKSQTSTAFKRAKEIFLKSSGTSDRGKQEALTPARSFTKSHYQTASFDENISGKSLGLPQARSWQGRIRADSTDEIASLMTPRGSPSLDTFKYPKLPTPVGSDSKKDSPVPAPMKRQTRSSKSREEKDAERLDAERQAQLEKEREAMLQRQREEEDERKRLEEERRVREEQRRLAEQRRKEKELQKKLDEEKKFEEFRRQQAEKQRKEEELQRQREELEQKEAELREERRKRDEEIRRWEAERAEHERLRREEEERRRLEEERLRLEAQGETERLVEEEARLQEELTRRKPEGKGKSREIAPGFRSGSTHSGDESEPAASTIPRPKSAFDKTSRINAPPGKRPVRPAKTGEIPRNKPAPVSIAIGTASQRAAMDRNRINGPPPSTSTLVSAMKDTFGPARGERPPSAEPQLGGSTSGANLRKTGGQGTIKGLKALEAAAAAKKAQEEAERKKAEQKLIISQRREENLRKQQEEEQRRLAASRQMRRTVERDLEPSKKALPKSGAPPKAGPSTSTTNPKLIRSVAATANLRKLATDTDATQPEVNKGPKRILQHESQEELQAYRKPEPKKRKTEDFEAQLELFAATDSKMAPPIRPSNVKQTYPQPPKTGYSHSHQPIAGQSVAPSVKGVSKATAADAVALQSTGVIKFSNEKIRFANDSNSGGSSHSGGAQPGGIASIGAPALKTPKMATKHTPKASPMNGDSIELPEIPTDSEEEDSEDEDISRKKSTMPRWAESPELREALLRQQSVDPDEIFGVIPPIHMDEIFKTRGKFRNRTSSANWSGQDRLTAREIEEDVEMRRRLVEKGGWHWELGTGTGSSGNGQ